MSREHTSGYMRHPRKRTWDGLFVAPPPEAQNRRWLVIWNSQTAKAISNYLAITCELDHMYQWNKSIHLSSTSSLNKLCQNNYQQMSTRNLCHNTDVSSGYHLAMILTYMKCYNKSTWWLAVTCVPKTAQPAWFGRDDYPIGKISTCQLE